MLFKKNYIRNFKKVAFWCWSIIQLKEWPRTNWVKHFRASCLKAFSSFRASTRTEKSDKRERAFCVLFFNAKSPMSDNLAMAWKTLSRPSKNKKKKKDSQLEMLTLSETLSCPVMIFLCRCLFGMLLLPLIFVFIGCRSFIAQEYIHRVGRTARGSGTRGHALLFLLPEELAFLKYLKHAKVFSSTYNRLAMIYERRYGWHKDVFILSKRFDDQRLRQWKSIVWNP